MITKRYGCTEMWFRKKEVVIAHAGSMNTREQDIAANVDAMYVPGFFYKLKAVGVVGPDDPTYMWVLKIKNDAFARVMGEVYGEVV